MVENSASFVLVRFGASTFGETNLRQSTYPLACDRSERVKQAWYVPPRRLARCGLPAEGRAVARRGWAGVNSGPFEHPGREEDHE